jgi:hypothetical protein
VRGPEGRRIPRCSSHACRRLEPFPGIAFVKTRRPSVFAVPVHALSKRHPFRESKGMRFGPFNTKTANRVWPRGVASFRTSYLPRSQAATHVRANNAECNAPPIGRCNEQSPLANHFSTPAICSSSSIEWPTWRPRSDLPFPPILPPNSFIRTEKKIGVNNTPKKVTPIIPANTAVPSA